jgi:hypothetical protein
MNGESTARSISAAEACSGALRASCCLRTETGEPRGRRGSQPSMRGVMYFSPSRFYVARDPARGEARRTASRERVSPHGRVLVLVVVAREVVDVHERALDAVQLLHALLEAQADVVRLAHAHGLGQDHLELH